MLQCIYLISSAFSSPASTADVAMYLHDQQCLFFTSLHCRCSNVFTWSAVPFLHQPSLQMLQCIYMISSAFSPPASTADVAMYLIDQQCLFFISLRCRCCNVYNWSAVSFLHQPSLIICCNVFTWSAVPFLHQPPLQMLQCIYLISSGFSSPAFTADVAMYLHDQQYLFYTSLYCRCCNVFTWSAVPFLHQPSLQMLQCIYMISSAFSPPASTADVAMYLIDQQCLFFTSLHCRCCNVFNWSAVPFLHQPSLQMLQCI